MLSRLDKQQDSASAGTQCVQTDIPLAVLKVLVRTKAKTVPHVDGPEGETVQHESTSTSLMVQYKDAGNALFRTADFHGALILYKRALCCEPASAAAVLLSNRSQCASNMQMSAEAALDADASIAITPNLAKHHYRRAAALSELHIEYVPASDAIVQLDQRLRLEIRRRREGDPHRPSGPAEKEKHQARSDPDHHMSTQESAMNEFERTFPSLKARDDRVEPFHEMFAQEGRWPRSYEVAAAKQHLCDA
jgi:tetratricopeptide (TPR) repeat protein